MKQLALLFLLVLATVSLQACAPQDSTKTKGNNMKVKVEKTDQEWKKELTPEQYAVLRGKATEAPFTGKLLYNKDKGVYFCAACGNPLFTSDTKFESGCGWPSFFEPVSEGSIIEQKDTSHGMTRTEILCGNCGSHLGHVFDDGPNPTGLRYCINSTALEFKKK